VTRLVLLALTAAVGCTHPSPSSDARKSRDSAAVSPGVSLDAVTWSIVQDSEGLTLLDGGGWRLRRDDGLELELYEGFLVVYTLVLESCDEPAARTPPPHGLPDHPSRTLTPIALSLHQLTPATLGGASFESMPFCEVGLTLFRGEAGDPGMPLDGSMDGLSFSMAGAVRSSPDSEWAPLELSSYLSVERDLPLVGDVSGEGAVTVVLRPAQMFAGLSLDGNPERLALDAMANLADSATVVLSAAR
jgi:hypothetical protein